LKFVDHIETEGFLDSQHRKMLLVAETPSELLDMFESYRAPKVEKWS
jgi:predicted Rossmann-fold nucleotide-binding protein